jgi:hypothetical protein
MVINIPCIHTHYHLIVTEYSYHNLCQAVQAFGPTPGGKCFRQIF